ncbi:hypothetical protein RCL1_007028 [Eukaryota sp. TZLM3-RCL]
MSSNVPAWKLALEQKRKQNTVAPPTSDPSPQTSSVPLSSRFTTNPIHQAQTSYAPSSIPTSSKPNITSAQNQMPSSTSSTRSSSTRTNTSGTLPATILSGTHTITENPEDSTSKLILAINKVQDAFNKVDMPPISLPQICVVGCQSSGKSSVLEAIVGRDFLPRGSGIVTRRPLVLQLIRDPSAIQDYGVFGHRMDEKFFDFDKIEREIQDETDRLCGRNTKNINSRPITLKVFSPNAINLTLVDLPGLTKVAVGGQDQSIVHDIKNMVMHFISEQNAIILAVSPANMDLANSDSLEVAKEVDPEGKRTIGVLTKLDLVDDGVDVVDVLEGRVYPMKFIGVVNRSQKDINQKKDMLSARADERAFFERHPAYAPLSHRMGTLFLAKKLNTALIAHIRSCMHGIRKDIALRLEEAEKELSKMGADDTDFSRRQTAFSMLQTFCRNYSATIEGSNAEELDKLGNAPHKFETDLLGGARIKKLFGEILREDIRTASVEGRLSDDQIRKYLLNTTGTNSVLNIPEQAFTGPIKVCFAPFFMTNHMSVSVN